MEDLCSKTFDHSGMSDCKPVNSPIVVNTDFTKNPQEPTNQEFIGTYQSHVGTHIWAYICGRSNLRYTPSTLSRFSSNLILEHKAAIKQLYRYLQATKNFKIVYRGRLTEELRLEMNIDVDWARDKETRKSTPDYISILAGALFPGRQKVKLLQFSLQLKLSILQPQRLPRNRC